MFRPLWLGGQIPNEVSDFCDTYFISKVTSAQNLKIGHSLVSAIEKNCMLFRIFYRNVELYFLSLTRLLLKLVAVLDEVLITSLVRTWVVYMLYVLLGEFEGITWFSPHDALVIFETLNISQTMSQTGIIPLCYLDRTICKTFSSGILQAKTSQATWHIR